MSESDELRGHGPAQPHPVPNGPAYPYPDGYPDDGAVVPGEIDDLDDDDALLMPGPQGGWAEVPHPESGQYAVPQQYPAAPGGYVPQPGMPVGYPESAQYAVPQPAAYGVPAPAQGVPVGDTPPHGGQFAGYAPGAQVPQQQVPQPMPQPAPQPMPQPVHQSVPQQMPQPAPQPGAAQSLADRMAAAAAAS
ncbi:MAG: hypothetical protein HOV66_14600, partial [Streptomycetaceae bacterium]|nr:hypothetical protein [Streptomycetaceae bacterium]